MPNPPSKPTTPDRPRSRSVRTRSQSRASETDVGSELPEDPQSAEEGPANPELANPESSDPDAIEVVDVHEPPKEEDEKKTKQRKV